MIYVYKAILYTSVAIVACMWAAFVGLMALDWYLFAMGV